MINKKGIIITALLLIVAGVLGYLMPAWITGGFLFVDGLGAHFVNDIDVEEKISPEVMNKVKEHDGEVGRDALGYIAVNMPADEIKELAGEKIVEGVYADRVYQAT